MKIELTADILAIILCIEFQLFTFKFAKCGIVYVCPIVRRYMCEFDIAFSKRKCYLI